MLRPIITVILCFLTSLFVTTWADELYNQAEVKVARDTVKILDDVYKSYVVAITEAYVKDPGTIAAATITKRVFTEVAKNGSHSARLISALEPPFNEENSPKDDFEKGAIKALKEGKTYFERVERVNGVDSLRAVTVVSAVMKQCLICHSDKKEGDLLGGISYVVPLKGKQGQ